MNKKPHRKRLGRVDTSWTDRQVAEELSAAYADSYQRISKVILKIPRGRIMTYGQVAEDAGLGRAARLVGYALHTLYVFVPWHRVLGKRSAGIAHVSIKDAEFGARQRILLEKEGVRFTASAGVSLEKYGFRLNEARSSLQTRHGDPREREARRSRVRPR
jgi:methylated-DNA-protein-cysteine methyltransferase-like protein